MRKTMKQIKISNGSGLKININFFPLKHKNRGGDDNETLISIEAPNSLRIENKQTIEHLNLTVYGSWESDEIVKDIIELGKTLAQIKETPTSISMPKIKITY